jgi:hypothetical protein
MLLLQTQINFGQIYTVMMNKPELCNIYIYKLEAKFTIHGEVDNVLLVLRSTYTFSKAFAALIIALSKGPN